jgi:anti-sigma28 factor (negative regulator of flagellin synthesis)
VQSHFKNNRSRGKAQDGSKDQIIAPVNVCKVEAIKHEIRKGKSKEDQNHIRAKNHPPGNGFSI